MNLRRHLHLLLSIAALLAVFCLLADVASACPTCKEGVIGQQKNMANGYAWSIMLMMAMPFTLLSLLGGYFYYEIRRARKAQSGIEAEEMPGMPAEKISPADVEAGT